MTLATAHTGSYTPQQAVAVPALRRQREAGVTQIKPPVRPGRDSRGALLLTARAAGTWLGTGKFYQVFVAVLCKRLLLLILVLGPAVGDHVVHDGWVVDGLRLAPGHLQGRLVQRLHLHVDGRRAAN